MTPRWISLVVCAWTCAACSSSPTEGSGGDGPGPSSTGDGTGGGSSTTQSSSSSATSATSTTTTASSGTSSSSASSGSGGGDTCTCAPEADATTSCAFGACQATCNPGFSRCNDVCVPESGDQCGATCEPCYANHGSPTCTDGVCGAACDAGFVPCLGGCCAMSVERVDPAGFGFDASIPEAAAGPDGTLHVTYEASAAGELHHAVRSPAGKWSFDAIAPWSDGGGSQHRVAVSPDGEPWVLYQYSNAGGGLTFARGTAAGWAFEYVDEHATEATGLAADAAGRAHACYTISGGGLGYALRSGDRWTTLVVDADPAAGNACAIATDSKGRAHVAYSLGATGDLGYALIDGGVAALTTVDGSTNDVGSRVAIAVDGGDHPKIVYFDATAQKLKYAAHDGAAWSLSDATDVGVSLEDLSMALDASGEPVATYFDYVEYRQRWARKAGAAWTTAGFDANDDADAAAVTADAQGKIMAVYGRKESLSTATLTAHGAAEQTPFQQPVRAGSSVSVALRGGLPIAAYEVGRDPDDLYTTAIRVAERSAAGAWSTFDFDGEMGAAPSIAVDAQGAPHVAWTADDGALRYAKRVGAAWQRQTVDAAAGADPSIAIDSAGKPRIVYTGAGALKIAAWSGAAWAIDPIESPSSAERPILRLAAGDVAHVVFYDAATATKDLRYATRPGATWALSTIDASGDAGYSHGLTLDAAGVPTVCYSYQGADNLIVATFTGGSWAFSSLSISGVRASGVCRPAFAAGHLTVAWSTAGIFGQVYLSTLEAGTWTHVGVEEQFLTRALDLAIDASGAPHVIYGGVRDAFFDFDVLHYAH